MDPRGVDRDRRHRGNSVWRRPYRGRIGRLRFPGIRAKTNAQCDIRFGGHSVADTPSHAVGGGDIGGSGIGGGRFGDDSAAAAHGQRRCPSANAHSGDSEAGGHGTTGTAADVDHAGYRGSGG
jgi:hypothetical protein